MAEPLALLLDDGVIDEVFTRLKSGKEADIYLVRHAGEVVAAKVYKERNARNFKNNAAYKEGRQVRNTRTQRAMNKGSRFGQEASEEAWKAKESEALHTLHAAGVRVPKPVMFYEGVLLMETILDSDGRPAPRLVEAAIPREKAAEWYADVRSQAVKMLACDLVHGDLSPYNVLLAWNGPTVIDFPQVVGAAHNSQAERFFERDLETIRRFFASHDPALNANAGDAQEIWRAFMRRELTPDFVPTGKRPERGHPQERRGDRQAERPPDRQPERRQGRQEHRRPEPERRGPPHGQPHPHAKPHAHPQPNDQRRPPPQPHGQRQPPPQPHGQRQPPPQPHGQRQPQPQRQQQPRHHAQPQRQGPAPQGAPPPDRGGGDRGRKGPAAPQVTVVQRLPGVAPAQPKREGGHGQPQGQPHGQGRGHRGRGHGHHKPR